MKAMSVVRAKGQVTIPARIRKAAQIGEDDPVEFEMTDSGILLRKCKTIPADQAWFWTPEWRAGEREADEEYSGGRGEIFSSDEEFLRALDERMHPDADA